MGFKLQAAQNDAAGTLVEHLSLRERERFHTLLAEEGKHVVRPIVALANGCQPDQSLDGHVLKRLQELGIVVSSGNTWQLRDPQHTDLGATFEWLVQSTLRTDLEHAANRRCHLETHIEGIRNAVGGADWDILATFKFNQLMWIECKFGHKIRPNALRAFVERSRVLRPDLALFLVNTDRHYGPQVRAALSNDIKNPPRVDVLDEPHQVVASAFPNRYFLRVRPRGDSRWLHAIKSGLQEVLHRHHVRMQRIVYDEQEWLA